MKNHILILLLLSQFFTACAQTPQKIDIPRPKDDVLMRAITQPKGYVTDFEFLFNETQIKELDSLIHDFEKRTTIQIAVVTLNQSYCDKADFEAYTLQLANTWGIGQKGKDNGVLVAISKQFRQIRIHNGKGIEKILTDEATRKIIGGYFVPKFKEEKYFEGTLHGLKGLISTLENNMEQKVQIATTEYNTFPKASFAGKWEYPQPHNNLVLLIEFEKGKDYATIIDVGTGEAPPFQLKAKMLNNKLVIFPQTHVNDLYIELSVKGKQLVFKYQIAISDKYGKALPPKKDSFLTRIYQKVVP